jgi:hypothetical protein
MKSFFIYALLFLDFSFFISAEDVSLPGRLGYSDICVAKFGKMKVFLYMDQEKDRQCRDLIPEINHSMSLTTYATEIDFPILEITPTASKFPEPIGYRDNHEPIYADLAGMQVLDKYASDTKKIAERCLGVNLKGGFTRDMSLIVNFDTNKFHQDQFRAQYNFLQNHPRPIPRYYLIQDLALVDWEMSIGTFSGTMIQDEDTKDRYILALFPHEVVGHFYAEPADHSSPDTPPHYPGPATLVPHCLFPPIDFDSSRTPGSSKGKRMSVILRALVREEEIDDLEKRSKKLPMNNPKIITIKEGNDRKVYPNGITLMTLPQPLTIERRYGYRYEDLNNTEVFVTKSENNKEAINILKQEFGIECSLEEVIVKHLIKKDEGFTNLSLESLQIPKESFVIIINNSRIPEKYQYYNLAERSYTEGLPWIQLYNFPPNMAMAVPIERFNNLALTPTEEIMFRDAREDIRRKDPNIFNEKIITIVDIFVFPKPKQSKY